MRRLAPLLAVAALLDAAAPRPAAAWSAAVHAAVHAAATQSLPPEFAAFGQWRADLERLAADADARRCCDPAEAMRHYIDIDAYDEFFAGTLPQSWDAMLARFGRQRVEANGIVPWAIEATRLHLVERFRAGDWPGAVAAAADLGHYVADAHQPLHLTVNYDGQTSGQRGIHSRYESVMTEIYARELALSPGHVSAYAEPLAAVFAWIETVYPGVYVVLDADGRARRAAGGVVGNPTYYEVLWRDTGPDTQRWLRQATRAVAGMWLTAWYDAGAPPLPGGTTVAVPAAGLRLLPNEPNPFNPTTTLRFEVPQAGVAHLRVYDVAGRLVRTLYVGDPGRGERSLNWDGRDDAGRPLVSGSYRLRLEQAGWAAVGRSVVLVR